MRVLEKRELEIKALLDETRVTSSENHYSIPDLT